MSTVARKNDHFQLRFGSRNRLPLNTGASQDGPKKITASAFRLSVQIGSGIFHLLKKAVHLEEKVSTTRPTIWCAEEIEPLAKTLEFFK
jgi:hypothetical protein